MNALNLNSCSYSKKEIPPGSLPFRILFTIFLLLSFCNAYGADFYAAPHGTQSGSGTVTSPFDLVTALSATSRVSPGDTLWLMSGHYFGNFNSYLTGTSAQPIRVRQIPNGHATIDGSLTVRGGWTKYWGFEITNTTIADRSLRPTAITTLASNIEFINLNIHDTGQGILTGADFTNVIIYGCLIHKNGYIGTDRPHGHGIYIQNHTGPKIVMDNVLFRGYAYGVHAYGQQGRTENLTFDGNIIYNNGMANFHLGGTQFPSLNDTIKNNLLYSTTQTTLMGLGYTAKGNRGLVLTGNTLINGKLQLVYWDGDIEVRNNRVYSSGDVVNFVPSSLSQVPLYPVASWDQNSYYTSKTTPFASDGIGWYSLANWRQTTGYDFNSSQIARTQFPEKIITIRPNLYESGRGYIGVYDRSTALSTLVDLSSIVSAGREYEVLQVDDIYGAPVATGIFNGEPVAIPRTTEFAVYLVVETGAAPVPTSTPTNTPTATATIPPTSTPTPTATFAAPTTTPSVTPTNTATPTVTGSNTLPRGPTKLIARAISRNQIDLSWIDNANNEQNFILERAKKKGGRFSKVAILSANSTRYSLSRLSRNITYYFRVKAVNTFGNSPYSNIASAKRTDSIRSRFVIDSELMWGVSPSRKQY